MAMMDRRSLLKRFGAIGLSIPAAMALERHVTLPTDVQKAIAMSQEPPQPGPFHRYRGRGYLDKVEIITERDYIDPNYYSLAPFMPGGLRNVRVHFEAVLADQATVEVLNDAFWERRNDREFIIDLPFIHDDGGRLRIR